MAEDNISIDYTSRDFESIQDDLIRTAQILLPEWTDLGESDPGRILLTLMAGVADKLHFYLDRAASESFLGTAVKRESIIKILKLINYELSGPVSAQTFQRFSLDQPFTNDDIQIPSGFELQTQANNPVKFETTSEAVISATSLLSDSDGSNTLDVESTAGFSEDEEVFINSDANSPIRRTIDEVFPETDLIQFVDSVPSGYNTSDNAYIEETSVTTTVAQGTTETQTLGESNGRPNQTFILSEINVAEDSDQLLVDDGEPEVWLEVDFFGANQNTRDVYTSQKTTDDFIRYNFGENDNGKIPKNGADIIASYRTSEGSDGNVGANTITTMNDTVRVNGQAVPLTTTNPEPAVGGSDRETKEEARRQGPLEFRTLNRAVTDRDYVILAEGFPGIAAAKATADTRQGLSETVYAVTENEQENLESAQIIKDNLQESLDARNLGGVPVNVTDPQFIDINVGGEIVYENNQSESEIKNRVESEINSFFEIGGNITGFDSNIFLSDLVERLDNLLGVNHVNLEQLAFDPESTIQKSPNNWEQSGSDTEFSFIELLDNSVRARYEIEFQSSNSNEFAVTKFIVEDGEEKEIPISRNVANDQESNQNEFVLDQEVEIENEVRFLLSSGTVPNETGDTATFKTSQFRNNIVFQEKEFPILGSILFEYIALDEKLGTS